MTTAVVYAFRLSQCEYVKVVMMPESLYQFYFMLDLAPYRKPAPSTAG
jgi:hypothetical protein